MNIHRKLSLLFVFAVLFSVSYAQVDQQIRPKSFLISAKLFSVPAELSYPFDLVSASELDHREDKAGHMPIFARSVPADISLTNSGTWTTLPDGGRVWRVKVSSPGALALIPCYDQFYLPTGATLHVYTPARDEVIGAFTMENNPKDGRYNTGLIHGDVCIIEYYEPASVAGLGRIHLNELGHAYRMVPGRKETQSGIGFGGSESCEVNVNCPEGENWQDQKNAVVRILVKTGSNYGWCSGTLVNNTNQDCTPYVLSADHCYQDDVTGALPSTGDLSDWQFYFQYQSPTCADPASEGVLADHFMTGCSFVAASLDTGGNSGSDFALLQLNTTPPLSYLPYYAGWSNIPTPSENGVGIHHPSADIKKISTYVTPLQSVSWGGVVPDTHWQILWAATVSGHGVTEPGSSGSPIFDFDQHIVGTLTGGGSDCTSPNNNDLYGKFSFHWASNGSTSNKRLQNWLDPANTGAQTLDGVYAPCIASLTQDAAVTGIEQAGTICDSNIILTCTLTNYGNNQLFQDSLYFIIDSSTVVPYLWTGSLNTLQSTTVSLPAQNFSTGTHTLTVTSAAPNAGADYNHANDSRVSTFNVTGAIGQYSFYMQTGDEGSQISWELTDLNNNVLYSGGPYTNNASGQVINESWCLPRACYDFNIFSASNNGLRGIILPGTYTIKDANGNTVSQLQQVNFGTELTVSVCQGANLGIGTIDASLSDIAIYPNPSTGIYTVNNIQGATSLSVTDAVGRLVMMSEIKGQTSSQVNLSGEESGIYFFKFTSDQGSTVKKVVLNSGK
jgi:hypothetical protein